MDYMLNEDIIGIREICAEIGEKYILPIRAELDEENRFPREIMDVLAQSDLFTIYIPRSTAEQVWEASPWWWQPRSSAATAAALPFRTQPMPGSHADNPHGHRGAEA